MSAYRVVGFEIADHPAAAVKEDETREQRVRIRAERAIEAQWDRPAAVHRHRELADFGNRLRLGRQHRAAAPAR